MDDGDRASAYAERQRALALENHRKQQAAQLKKSQKTCVDCGFEIERQRQAIGALRCAECAPFFEREQILKGRR